MAWWLVTNKHWRNLFVTTLHYHTMALLDANINMPPTSLKLWIIPSLTHLLVICWLESQSDCLYTPSFVVVSSSDFGHHLHQQSTSFHDYYRCVYLYPLWVNSLFNNCFLFCLKFVLHTCWNARERLSLWVRDMWRPSPNSTPYQPHKWLNIMLVDWSYQRQHAALWANTNKYFFLLVDG